MPLYDYVCAACGRRFEVIHGVHGEPPASCPLCGQGPVRKAITAPAVHYKGSGWAKKERRAAVKAGSSPGGTDDGSTGAGSSAGEDGSAGAGSSASEDGSSRESGSSGTDGGPSEAAPAAAATGGSSKGTPKPSKPGKAATAPARDRD